MISNKKTEIEEEENGFKGVYCNFCHYLRKYPEFDSYFRKSRPSNTEHPKTKAKVEAPMKILDEIRAYNGKLNYRELVELVIRINNRVNTQVNHSSMFHYKGCQYSVAPEYVGKIVLLQVYDGYIHVYCNGFSFSLKKKI